MRNLKKVLALVVAFSMMLSVVAFASFNDVAEDADYAGAVELLSALDIIVGDDLGNFNPDNTITRAEMAAIVCRIKGLEASANAAKGNTIFTDVPADHWASGYVNIANQNGIIAGYGDGLFGPEDQVTYEAAVKMVVSALGFEPMAAQKGGWPTGYLVVANTYKISEGVAGSTRADVAVLVSNAMSTPVMDQSVYGADAEFEVLDGKKGRDYRTLLTDMDIYVATGTVDNVNKADAIVEFTVTEDSDDLEFEKGDTPDFEINGSNIADYQFQNVDVYVKKTARKDYKVVAVVPGLLSETFTLISDDVVKDDDGNVVKTAKGIEYYVDAANSSKTKELNLAIDTVIYNKKAQDDKGYDVYDIAKMDDVELVFIENDGEKGYDVVVATKYTSGMVTSVEDAKNRITIKVDVESHRVALDYEDEEDTIILCDDAGKELELADFAEDDVVAVVYSGSSIRNYGDYIKIVKISNAAVTGVVEESYVSNNDKYIVVDGKELKVGTDKASTIDVGDEGIFYVGMTGKVIYFDVSAAGNTYGYILDAGVEKSTFGDPVEQVKILTEKDGIVVYDLTDTAADKFDEKAYTWDETDASKNDSYSRLVTYKTNSKGQIKEITVATEDDYNAVSDEYNAKSQKVDFARLEDDVVVFVISDTDMDNAYASDLGYLVADAKYVGSAYKDKNGYSVLVITEGDAAFSEEAGLAIATKVTKAKDEDENDIVKVSYVQGEEEGVVIFNEDSTPKGAVKYDALGEGDVFVFNSTADGIATQYAVIAQIKTVSDNKQIVLCADMTAEKVKSLFSEDTVIAVGYIKNTAEESTANYEIITLDKEWKDGKDEVEVSADTFKYTYNNSGRKVAIEVGTFWGTDNTDYNVDGYATPVLVRLYDGDVIDIYTSNDRIAVGE